MPVGVALTALTLATVVAKANTPIPVVVGPTCPRLMEALAAPAI
jgi:hypothetical protein